MTSWWVELDAFSSPHHHEHSDGSQRRHSIYLKVPAKNPAEAVGVLERVLQTLVAEQAAFEAAVEQTSEGEKEGNG